jgi:hypothetical protein
MHMGAWTCEGLIQPLQGWRFLMVNWLTQGSSCLATLICSPICALEVISWRSLLLRTCVSPPRGGECFALRCSTEASVASRSGTAQREAGGKAPSRPPRRPSGYWPHLVTAFLWSPCFSCAGKNMRPPPLRKERSAACASSCNPRTALGQSVAQPEPRTPGAPNSNGCQSGGQDRQLV